MEKAYEQTNKQTTKQTIKRRREKKTHKHTHHLRGCVDFGRFSILFNVFGRQAGERVRARER